MRRLAALAACLSACAVVPDRGTLPNAPARVHSVQTVTLDPELDAYEDSLEAAVDLWNDAAGAEVLRVVSDGPYDILVTTGRGPAGALACASPRAGVILFLQPGDTYQAYLVLAHELGHAAFWLDHDLDHGYSIMAMVGGAPEGELFPAMRYHGVTAADARRVRAMTGR